MMGKLRYYIAHNSGLQVSIDDPARATVGEFFAGHTVDHLIGPPTKPQIVFAAVDGDGGHRTLDGGKTWQKILNEEVRQFAIDPHDENVIYAGMCPVRLLRSEDGGTTWEPLDGLLDMPAEVQKKWDAPEVLRDIDFPHVRDIFIHPDDANLIFVLLEHGGVLLSRDRGKTFEDRSEGIDYVDMHRIENTPGSKDQYFVSSARGFFRTDDCGKHWRRIEKGMPWGGTEKLSYSHGWRFMPGSQRVIVCGAKGSPAFWGTKDGPKGHLIVSDDRGENWRVVTKGIGQENPWFPHALLQHPTEPRTLFCGMGDGCKGFGMTPDQRGNGAWYISRDAGDSWEAVLSNQPSIISAWVAAE
jgi:photosystem II stability/assembly factor-like uncharacterized protein